jgi:hypothetical protein
MAWLQERIIEKKTATTPLAQIDPEAERSALDSSLVKERIEKTARNCAQAVWSKLRDEWWRRYPVFLETKPRRVKIVRVGSSRDAGRDGVKGQHYSPDFSNRYWADTTGRTMVFSLAIGGSVTAKIRPVRKWGKEDFLKSVGQPLTHFLLSHFWVSNQPQGVQSTHGACRKEASPRRVSLLDETESE